jgi:hypothetical protein
MGKQRKAKAGRAQPALPALPAGSSLEELRALQQQHPSLPSPSLEEYRELLLREVSRSMAKRPPTARSSGRSRIMGATYPEHMRQRLAADIASERAHAAAAKQARQAEIHRLMSNWAQWKVGGASISLALSGAYRLAARGRRDAGSVPLIDGEALAVDHAVTSLPRELRQAIEARWLDELPDQHGRPRKRRSASLTARAQACGCSLPTYYRRLDRAHEQVMALLQAKRNDARYRRAQAEATVEHTPPKSASARAVRQR